VPALTIHIEVDGEFETVEVIDDAGNKKSLKSILVIGGSHDENALYCFSGGSSSDLGWALGAMYRFQCMSDRQEENHLRKAFNQMLAWICTFMGIPLHGGKQVDPATLLKRWNREDVEQAQKEYEEMTGAGRTH
jgi:hypothetical protein